jgi:hypothetical protein
MNVNLDKEQQMPRYSRKSPSPKLKQSWNLLCQMRKLKAPRSVIKNQQIQVALFVGLITHKQATEMRYTHVFNQEAK